MHANSYGEVDNDGIPLYTVIKTRFDMVNSHTLYTVVEKVAHSGIHREPLRLNHCSTGWRMQKHFS